MSTERDCPRVNDSEAQHAIYGSKNAFIGTEGSSDTRENSINLPKQCKAVIDKQRKLLEGKNEDEKRDAEKAFDDTTTDRNAFADTKSEDNGDVQSSDKETVTESENDEEEFLSAEEWQPKFVTDLDKIECLNCLKSWWKLLFLSGLVVIIAIVIAIIFLRQLQPEILFEQEYIHVQPSKGPWKIKVKCRSSDRIKKCIWEQLRPDPRTKNMMILEDDAKDCLKIPSKEVDASLNNMKIPETHGTYMLQLSCTDNSHRRNTQRFYVRIGTKPAPIVYNVKHHVNVSIESGSVQLYANCRALNEKRIVNRRWEYISGPDNGDTVVLSKDGNVKFNKPGVYKFQYKCTDNHGMESESNGSIVRVAVKPPYILGIDLGTSTTCVSYINEIGLKQDIKLNDDANEDEDQFCMPSVVAFGKDGQLLIGKKALNQAVVNPLSTIYEVKRLIGQSFYQVDGQKFVYRVRPTLKTHSPKGMRAAIDIPCKGYANKLLQPEVVSALILRHVVSFSEAKLGVSIKDVIISVPAQFDDAQRKATMDAGRIAGLNPQKIVNEPTVGAFAASTIIDDLRGAVNEAEQPEPKHTKPSVVVDIGGGTSDYSFMHILGSYFKVVTTEGNKVLGGRDLDMRLTEKMIEIFKSRITDPGVDFDDANFRQNLRIECEKAKRELSDKNVYTLKVRINVAGQGDIILRHSLTRHDFETYTSDILNAMIKPLDSLLRRGNTTKRNIEDLYLIGGSVQIPKLQQLLKEQFPNVTNPYMEEPVQAVSRGAAKFGALHSGIMNATWRPRVDTLPLPIKIMVDYDSMYDVFERNSLYPCSISMNLTTYTNNQSAIVINVYEGECATVTDNCHFLGEFKLSGIKASPKGVPKIKATFTVDGNGILNITASCNIEDWSVENTISLDICSSTGSMSAKEVSKLSALVHELLSPVSTVEQKCSLLENAPYMPSIPPEPNKSNVLKIAVDSMYGRVKMFADSSPEAKLSVIAMVSVEGYIPNTVDSSQMAEFDFVLILDKSRSMQGNRMKTMKNLILYFINSILNEKHRLGVVSFNDKATHLIELIPASMENKKTASEAITSIETSGETNTYDGLLAGLRMAYKGGKRACVMLFTDGHPNAGHVTRPNDIVRNVIRVANLLKQSSSKFNVDLHTFGIFGYKDQENFLRNLAESVGHGNYYNVNANNLATAFSFVVSNAINQVAEDLTISLSPSSDRVKIKQAMTKFKQISETNNDLVIKIPVLADQQSRHVLLELTVFPTQKETKYEELFSVTMTYRNSITNEMESCDEYLYVGRSRHWAESHFDVMEQHNRVKVAKKLDRALRYVENDDPKNTLEELKEAEEVIKESPTNDRSLSMCIRNELEELMSVAKENLEKAKIPLQESLRSHWYEKGGHNSCYLTHKENTMITVVRRNITIDV